jgi:hypothetical protein
MKNFIKVISIATVILFTTGCGGDVDRTNLDEDTSPISKDKSIKKDPITIPKDTNKTVTCEELLKKDPNTIEILDSALECPPNVDLYHAEVKPTYFKYQYDESFKGNVLYFKSNDLKNAIHILGYDTNKTYEWDGFAEYQNKLNISWDSKFSNDFYISVVVSFMDGKKAKKTDLIYSPSKNGYAGYTDGYHHISLGDRAKDGQWHHYERNILDDLHIYFPNATINYNDDDDIHLSYVNGFALRGTGSITDIMLKE